MIRRTISEHLDKEKCACVHKDIKVLSLFFIDAVDIGTVRYDDDGQFCDGRVRN